MFKRILVPLDGSTTSEQVLGWVSPVAATLGAEVILLAVTAAEPPSPVPVRPTGMPQGEPPEVIAARSEERSQYERAAETARGYLAVVERRLEPYGVEARSRVVTGSPEQQIVNVAAEMKADLIAMATRRESALARGVLGSVADRVLHTSAIPVLLLRPESPDRPAAARKITTIVVPLDMSLESEAAAGVGIGLARAFGAAVRFVRVTPNVYFPGPAGIGYGGYVYFGAQLRAEAHEYMREFVGRASAQSVDGDSIVVSGNVANSIIDVAKRDSGSMIVMTTHGETGFRRWVLGSVTDKVVRGSEQPVLVIPSKAAMDMEDEDADW